MYYEHNMKDEKEPTRKKLIPEGLHEFKIISCEASVSKNGNDMFIIELFNNEHKCTEKIYPISTQGKRWFLKTLLDVCGIEAAKDGVYSWNVDDIIGKDILCEIEHEDNEWVNRDGETIKSKQNRIVNFEQLAWDESK